jgi:predicted TIM-barrel fold metal-dependent hydrolase
MADAVAALVSHGALSRFPNLRVMSVENGSDWVERLLELLAGVYKKMPQQFPEDPIEAIRRNFFISPFWEDDIQSLGKLLPLDHIVFGSDYPHPEGLRDPLSRLDHLGGLSDDEVRDFMGGTLTRLIDSKAA